MVCRLQGQLKHSAGDDEIVLRIESGDAQVSGERWHNCLLLAADMDPFALVERAVAAAAAMSGRPYIISCRMPTMRYVAGRETGIRPPHK